MKEFLKGLWGLFVFVMLLAGMFTKCEADRIKQQQINEQQINERRNLRADYSAPKQAATPQFRPYLSDYPKIPTWQQWDRSKFTYKPVKTLTIVDVAPMPRAKREVAPMPHEIESEIEP